MKEELFAELLASANEALDHARGKRDLKTASVPTLVEPMSARDVLRVRKSLRASQGLLARYLSVSTKLVQAWEADRRHPSGPALVLLRMLEREPGLVDAFFSSKVVASGPSAREQRRAARTGRPR